ncbi:hypothetical protein NT01EI_1371 [Edwardsiella ictaluri 93-146]|uniref:Uncharacterized protein n=1 Tax=Edwardsiella ictaluri (strain 93-146) TaxID=634503 RepID=C5BD66_EDWI9|nr:hypothetical protein NT01EI_1371 [Edwardsiella ictaluri 93-146]
MRALFPLLKPLIEMDIINNYLFMITDGVRVQSVMAGGHMMAGMYPC